MLYDLIILGSGPAGLSAGLYAGRYKLKTLLIGASLGGVMAEAWKIENYPGFKSVAGMNLAKTMKEQAGAAGAEIIQEEVVKIQDKNAEFQIITRSGKTYQSRSLILALGTQRRKLNVPGEEKFHGRGVAYCATCDGVLFRDKTVVIVGGGDSAIKSALLLEKYAKNVYLLIRGKELSAEPANIEQVKGKAKGSPKLKIIYEVEVIEIKGGDKVQGVKLNNGQELTADGVFIEIGTTPSSVLVKDLSLALDEKGYIKVNEEQRTNLSMVYAAGDVCTGMGGFKQVLTAAGQGAVAATSAYKDLARKS